jgi:hypothetical protein
MKRAAKPFSRVSNVSGNQVLLDAEFLFRRTLHVCGESFLDRMPITRGYSMDLMSRALTGVRRHGVARLPH